MVNPYQSTDTDSHQQSQYDGDVRLWAMILHLSVLAGNTIPIAGWILPIAVWQIKKDEMPELDAHGRIVVNWLISSLIYMIIFIPLVFVFVGIPLLVMLYLANIAFAIIGGIKANSGEAWHYPLSIRFL